MLALVRRRDDGGGTLGGLCLLSVPASEKTWLRGPSRDSFVLVLPRRLGVSAVKSLCSLFRRSLGRLLRRGLAETALHHIVGIGGNGAVAPQPAHHLGKNHAAELLPVKVHAPRVVHVVTLLREGLHQPDILVEPIALLVVSAGAHAPIVVPPVAQEYANGLLLARQHSVRIHKAALQVHEAADAAEH